MKIPTLLRQAALCAASFLIITGSVSAQNAGQGGRRDNPAKAALLKANRQAADKAKAQALAGDLAGAESALDDLSGAPKNSAARQFDTAQRLTELANNLMRSGEPRAAAAAASRALAMLGTAEKLSAGSSLQSAIQSQKGELQERFLADRDGARASFQAAVDLDPGNPAAREKLNRVKAEEAYRRAKVSDQNR